MRVLDAFSGEGGASAAFRDRGHDVTRVELNPKQEAEIHANILTLKPSDLAGEWDFIWASPPCPCFSPGGNFGHFEEVGFKRFRPRDEEAFDALTLVNHTRNLIEVLNPKGAIIENPRGLLRHLWPTAGLHRATAWYCRYGDNSAKPTDFWLFGEAKHFRFLTCENDSLTCHHDRAPRGAKTGTQGKKGAAARAVVPYGVSLSVCEQMEARLARVEPVVEPGRLAV